MQKEIPLLPRSLGMAIFYAQQVLEFSQCNIPLFDTSSYLMYLCLVVKFNENDSTNVPGQHKHGPLQMKLGEKTEA